MALTTADTKTQQITRCQGGVERSSITGLNSINRTTIQYQRRAICQTRKIIRDV